MTSPTPVAQPSATKATQSTLWDIAFAQLDPTTQSLLKIVNTTKLENLQTVLQEAEKVKSIAIQKQWKISLKGKDIILRDVVDKIITWVNRFKVVGDVAVQFDTGAASLPWAAVRLILQICVDDKQCREATIQGIEAVTCILARYSVIEQLYLRPGSIIYKEFDKKLVTLYAQILTLLSESIKFFKVSTAKRTLRSIFQASHDDQLHQIIETEREIRALQQIVDTEILQSLQLDIVRLVDASLISTKTVKDQEFRSFQAWLSTIPHKKHHQRHSRERLSGTADWLLRNTQYMDWKDESDSAILWLHGLPGCGKTKLASRVIDAFLHDIQTNPQAVPIAYFYCGDAINGDGVDACDVLRSLTRQLSVIDHRARQIHRQALIEYERRCADADDEGSEVEKLDCGECVDLLAELLLSNPAVLVIDGVDEIYEQPGLKKDDSLGQTKYELLRSLVKLRDMSASVVKIFLTSREDGQISRWANDHNVKNMHVQNTTARADMENFVKHCIDVSITEHRMLDGQLGASLQASMTTYLLDRADGMFLWVQLQVRQFCSLKSEAGIENAMQNEDKATLANINKLYSQILKRIEGTDQQMHKAITRAFSWISCTREPLELEALLEAISVGSNFDINQSEFLGSCANLLCVDPILNVVQFAHASVKDYLGTLSDFDLRMTHGIAAVSCLDLCNTCEVSDISSGVHPGQSISVYAAMYWAYHYNSAGATIQQYLDLDQKVIEFFFVEDEDSLCFEMWVDLVEDISQMLPRHHELTKQLNAIKSEPPTPLFAACIFGFESVLEVLLSRPSFDIDQRNSKDHTGLYLASTFGHDELISRLLTNGADAMAVCGKFGNAFYAACANGNNGALDYLQKHLMPTQPGSFFETALELSLRGGHSHTAEFLLKECVSIDTQKEYDKLFDIASDLGTVAILQYLRTRYPKYTASKPVSSKALDSAFRKGLLSQIKAYAKRTPLPIDSIAIASYYGQNETVLFCLDTGLDIEEVGSFGSPLRAASLMGHASTVRKLLDHGAAVNNGGIFGDPLQAAAMHGHVDVAEILLQYGAGVNNSGGYYGNALQAAAYRGHEDVTQLLISSGADMYQSGLFRNTFCAAITAGQDNIIELLIRNGYSGPAAHPPPTLHAPDPPTIKRQLLLEKSLTMTFTPEKIHLEAPVVPWERGVWKGYDNPCASALLDAASSGNFSVAANIVRNWSELRVGTDTLIRSLEISCEHGHVEIASIILQTADIPSEKIRDSLDRAAWHGSENIVAILLDHEEIYGSPSSANFELYSPKQGLPDSLDGPPIKKYWADYLHPTTKPSHLNETYANGHIVRTLLQGCRGDKPSSVALALRLAPDYGLKNMLEASFLEAAAFDSVQVLNRLMKLYEQNLLPLVPSGYNMAIMHGALASVAFMMKHFQGVVPRTVQLPSFLRKVIESGNTEALQQFLSQGPHSYEPLEWGLIQAAKKGHVHILQVLYDQRDRISSFDVNAAKALHEAAAHGHFAAVEFLVQSGANLKMLRKSYVSPDDTLGPFDQLRGSRWTTRSDWNDNIPRSCLQACFDPLFRLRTESVKISDDCFPGVKSKTSKILSRQEEVLVFLMRHGAPISTTDKFGRSILHWAALTCSEISVREVLKYGPSVYTNDNNGMSPLAYAAARELDSLCVFNALLEFQDANETDVPAPDYTQLLTVALKNFKNKPHGSFYESESIYDVLNTGSGAIVKKLLHLEPGMKAVGDGFGLLLQMVAICGDTDYLDLLIDREVEVSTEGYYYGSALQAAARFGRLDSVRKLLKAGANVNQGRKHDAGLKWEHSRCCSPLHAAVLSGHSNTVRLILDAGVDMKLRDYSCVFEAAGVSGNAALVRLLLPKASAFGDRGETKETDFGTHDDLLTIACRTGSEDIVQLLLKHDRDPWDAILHHLRKGIRYRSNDSPTEIKRSVSAREDRIIKQLLDAVKNISDKDFNATLFDGRMILDEQPMAIGNFIIRELLGTTQFVPFCSNNVAFVRAWVEDGDFILHVCSMPKTPDLLIQVSILGAQNCIDMILDAGVEVQSRSTEGEYATHLAAIFGKYRAVEHLLYRGADAHSISPNFGSLPSAALQSIFKGDALATTTVPSSEEKIHAACSLIIRLIQDNNIDIKTAFQDSVPPLYYASYVGSVPLVALCLDQGMDANQVLEYRGPPLAAAIGGDRGQVVDYLLSRGADTNTSWTHYESLVHYACEFFENGVEGLRFVYPISEQHVSELIEWDELDEDKRSETRLLSHIETLLRAGADIKLQSPSFGTYMHLACKYRAMGLVTLFTRYGADPNATDSEKQSPLSVLLTGGRGSHKTVAEKNLREFLHSAPEVRVQLSDDVLAFEFGPQGYSLRNSSKNIIQILLDHDSTIVIDENLVDMIGKDTETLSMLLDRAPDLKLSSELIKASSKHYVSSFKLIIQNQLRFYSPQELFDMLPSDDHYFGRGVVVLLQQDSTYCPPVTTISTLLEMRSPVALFAIELMLNRSPHLTVTALMLTKAVTADDDPRRWQENSRHWRENEPHLARHYQKTRLQLLLDHDKHCRIPQELIQLCQEPKHSDSMKTLKEHDPSIWYTVPQPAEVGKKCSSAWMMRDVSQ